MAYQIVTVNVSQEVGAIPSTLQQTGALVSCGSTLLPAGTHLLITQKSEITDLITIPISSLVADEEVLTIVLEDGYSLTPAFSVGDEITITVAGATPDTFNGTWIVDVTSASTLTTATAPEFVGTATAPGTMQLGTSNELAAMGNTFFAQGDNRAVYVFELGFIGSATPAEVDEKINYLREYIEDPDLRFYTYLLPIIFDLNESFIQLARDYSSNTAMLYFFIQTLQTNSNAYSGIKSIVSMSADSGASECNIAGLMWQYISASPSDMNKVPPMSNRYLFGVTVMPGKGSALKLLKDNRINYVGTGAEGGMSNTLVVGGVSSDGNDLTYWYSVDWVQINIHLALANTVINGSNDPVNPLYFEQDGIDRLQNTAQGKTDNGVTYGLINGNPKVQAVPFKTYVKNNPNDYPIGRYAGMSLRYTPNRGFTEIIFNIVVTMQLS